MHAWKLHELKATVPPPRSLVSVAECKSYVPIFHQEDDLQLKTLHIPSAEDMAQRWLSRQFLTATYSWTFGRFPEDAIYPPLGQWGKFVKLEYQMPGDSAMTEIAESELYFRGGADRPEIRLINGRWPYDADRVILQYECGYGSDPSSVPAIIRQFVLWLVTHYWSNPEPIVMDADFSQVPLHLADVLKQYLLQPYPSVSPISVRA